jgi:hypothetical protein
MAADIADNPIPVQAGGRLEVDHTADHFAPKTTFNKAPILEVI